VIYDYLYENFGFKIAEVKLQEIKDIINVLHESPFFGRAIFDNLRKLNSGPCIIIYEVTNVVEILHIVDGRSDYMETLFGGD